MNLLDETKGAISRSGHSTDDVRFVGSRDEKLGITWSQAEKVLDIDYDDGYGGQEISADLVVVFTDGGFLRREAYQTWLAEHDRQIAEQAWEDGYIQAVRNMNPMPGEEPPTYTPNPYAKKELK